MRGDNEVYLNVRCVQGAAFILYTGYLYPSFSKITVTSVSVEAGSMLALRVILLIVLPLVKKQKRRVIFSNCRLQLILLLV